jgi:hypothetical protein
MSDAGTLVPQITAAHKAYLTASEGALEHAFRAGELLNLAQESVGRVWLKWLEANCPDIPQTTASMYMRLADNRAFLFEEANQQRVASLRRDGKLSIRSALSLLPKKPRKAGAGKITHPNRAKRSLAIEEQLQAMDIDEVFKILKDALQKQQLEALTELLEEHLDPEAVADKPAFKQGAATP